jgi:hypothetical protein
MQLRWQLLLLQLPCYHVLQLSLPRNLGYNLAWLLLSLLLLLLLRLICDGCCLNIYALQDVDKAVVSQLVAQVGIHVDLIDGICSIATA